MLNLISSIGDVCVHVLKPNKSRVCRIEAAALRVKRQHRRSLTGWGGNGHEVGLVGGIWILVEVGILSNILRNIGMLKLTMGELRILALLVHERMLHVRCLAMKLRR